MTIVFKTLFWVANVRNVDGECCLDGADLRGWKWTVDINLPRMWSEDIDGQFLCIDMEGHRSMHTGTLRLVHERGFGWGFLVSGDVKPSLPQPEFVFTDRADVVSIYDGPVRIEHVSLGWEWLREGFLAGPDPMQMHVATDELFGILWREEGAARPCLLRLFGVKESVAQVDEIVELYDLGSSANFCQVRLDPKHLTSE